MATEIAPVPNDPNDRRPDSVATPEGDNEFAPDQPLQPSSDDALDGLQVPRGNAPDPYKGE